MANLKKTIINSTDYINVPKGLTSQRPSSLSSGELWYNTELSCMERYDGSGWVSSYGRSAYTPASTATALKQAYPNLPTGFYWLNPGGLGAGRYWCDMDYDGGGWVLVMCNRKNTQSMTNLTYDQAVNTGRAVGRYDSSLQFNLWAGVKFYPHLGLNVAQFCATAIRKLSETSNHTKRYRWAYTGLTSKYGFTGAVPVSDETGTGAPGLLTTHAAPSANLTTYDKDQDSSGTNCSTNYTNTPWWYTSCWNGSMWGGGPSGSQQNAPHWSGSTIDNHNYMAIYLKA